MSLTIPVCHKPRKWLLYSSTVVLIIFLFAVVECSSSNVIKGSGPNQVLAQSLTAIENETTGKAKADRNGFLRADGKNQITSNELHSTYNFNDEDLDDDLSQSYDDEEGYVDSDEPPETGEFSEEDLQLHQPKLTKCCLQGQGLGARGDCEKIKKHNYHGDDFWFPDSSFDLAVGKKVTNNISEWEISYSPNVKCRTEAEEKATLVYRFMILNDGSLFLHEHGSKHILPGEFCLDRELGKGQGHVVKACLTKHELCEDRQCLRKCCPKNSFTNELDHGAWRCEMNTELSKQYHFSNSDIFSSSPQCKVGTRVEVINQYNISENGTLQTPDSSHPLLTYCIDYFINTSHIDKDGHLSAPKLKAIICFDKADNPDHQLIVVSTEIGIALGTVMLLSAVCLAVAAIISWRLPELRSLHGKCQLSHLITMFCFYLSLAIAQLGTVALPQGFCTFLGIFIHTCALSSFLWLNLLCVNIYLTFRSLRPPLGARRDENRRLFFLCIYAWGIPLAFTLFLFYLDSSPGRLDPMPSPNYGLKKCLISNREAEFAYLFGPVGVLLLLNGIMFCLTAQELLCGLWRLDNSDSINFRRKSMGIVVAKLGIVMGLGWIIDVVSWVAGEEKSYIFYFADFFNSFQGVLISVILLWRKRVLEVLHLRRPSMNKDETLTARPFLPKNSSINVVSNGDNDTSLVIVHDH